MMSWIDRDEDYLKNGRVVPVALFSDLYVS